MEIIGTPQITEHDEKIVDINPFIYGNFMEFIERHIPGMWAEMLEYLNDFESPNRIAPAKWEITGKIAYFKPAPCSLTLLRIYING
ncbi:MAG: hypothetical protein FWH55_00220 [Oscillospiraceae bacterium]|nr:hypothetical protein [Oscillospiraceae bacterium]